MGTYVRLRSPQLGGVWCWGAVNDDGQLGNGTTDVPGPSPIQPAPGRRPHRRDGHRVRQQPDAGVDGAPATGAVVCWGMDEGGLGGPWSEYSATPVTVVGLSGAVDVRSTARSSCAIRADGTAACWGDLRQRGAAGRSRSHRRGGVGSDGPTASSMPTAPRPAVSVERSITARRSPHGPVSTMGSPSQVIRTISCPGCALHVDASVSCFGLNSRGALADGAPDFATTPSPSVAGGGVSLGGGHACAVGFNILCWGATTTRDSSGSGRAPPRGGAAAVVEPVLPVVAAVRAGAGGRGLRAVTGTAAPACRRAPCTAGA